MKHRIAGFLAIIMLFALTACSAQQIDEQTDGYNNTSEVMDSRPNETEDTDAVLNEMYNDLIAQYIQEAFQEKIGSFNYYYPDTATMIDHADHWYLVKFNADEFSQPNNLSTSRIYEVYVFMYINSLEVEQGCLKNVTYDESLGSYGLLYTSRNIAFDGPGDQSFIDKIKNQANWGTTISHRTSDPIAIRGTIRGTALYLDETVFVYVDDILESFDRFELPNCYKFPVVIDGYELSALDGKSVFIVGYISSNKVGDVSAKFIPERTGVDGKDTEYNYVPESMGVSDSYICNTPITVVGILEKHTGAVGGGYNSTYNYWTLTLEAVTKFTDKTNQEYSCDIVDVDFAKVEISDSALEALNGKQVCVDGVAECVLNTIVIHTYSITENDSANGSSMQSDGTPDNNSASTTEPTDDILTGTWWDTDSQRCSMKIELISDNTYSVVVEWASSAFENTVWTMTAIYDSGLRGYVYKDCVKQNIAYDSSGNETITDAYADGSGRFFINGDHLFWVDDKEGVRDECPFEKEQF